LNGNKYFIPGSDKQLKHLLNYFEPRNKKILVIGSGCEECAKVFLQHGSAEVYLIVEDNDSLISARVELTDFKQIQTRLMEYDNLDFIRPKFDLVFAQASVSNKRRNKIIKELKRVSVERAIISIGELVNLSKEAPAFVNEAWERSSISPLFKDEIQNYYSERKFEILAVSDISSTLKNFYTESKNMLETALGQLEEVEKKYYKKLLKKISHESNVFLNLGGDKHMGFISLVLRKV